MNELIRKYLEGSITPEELNQLLEYYSDAAHRSELAEVLQSEFDRSKSLSPASPGLPPFFEDLDRRTLDKVKSRISQSQKGQRTRRNAWIRTASVAAVLVLLAVMGVLMSRKQDPQEMNLAKAGNIAPGGNRAFITLEGGRRIELDSLHARIRVIGNGLEYDNGEHIASFGALAYASLQTPRGGQYSVILPDGSQVWLNAASSLRYPLRFDQAVREVELDGEAFFEVAKDESRPFVVKSHGQQVKVLGTSFNVNAYANEEKIATTLVEGKIKVESLDGAFQHVLQPGQQGQYTADGLSVIKVDPTEFVAWRDGLIMFHGDNLPEIIDQLERWYDVEFDELPEGVAPSRVFGMIHRSVPLSDLLKTLSDNYENIQFEIHGRRITMDVR